MCLSQLQEDNVAFGSQAVYASGANYAQATVDFAINRAYAKVLTDLADISLISETITFPSVSGQFAYPVPIGSAAQGTLTAARGTGSITGVVLTTTINGTPLTYTCVSTDTALSAITQLAAKVNASTLVVSGTPTINPMQISLNGAAQYVVQAYAPGTAGNAITLTCSSSNSTVLSITASGGTLSGGTAQSPYIRTVRSVYYQPLGLTYNIRRAPGVRLISWEEYQQKTVDGYLQYFSAGLQPDYVAMDTQRQNLYLFPTPFNTGDTITFQYAPQLTNSANVPATNWGYLSNPTDQPPAQFPEDACDCIWMYATFLLWPKSREIGTAHVYLDMYKDKLKEIIANYFQASQGASFGIRDKAGLVGQSYGWYT